MLETSSRSWLDLEKHNVESRINNLWNRQWISLLWIDCVSWITLLVCVVRWSQRPVNLIIAYRHLLKTTNKNRYLYNPKFSTQFFHVSHSTRCHMLLHASCHWGLCILSSPCSSGLIWTCSDSKEDCSSPHYLLLLEIAMPMTDYAFNVGTVMVLSHCRFVHEQQT